MDTENWDEGFEIGSEPQAEGQFAPSQWTNGPGASFLDHALNAGTNFDWVTPMISIINFTVGSHVGYGIYTNFVSTKYAMCIVDLKGIFRRRGIDFCSTMLIDVGEEEKFLFDVPIDQKEHTEEVMNKYGILWFGGLRGWGEWGLSVLGLSDTTTSGADYQLKGGVA